MLWLLNITELLEGVLKNPQESVKHFSLTDQFIATVVFTRKRVAAPSDF